MIFGGDLVIFNCQNQDFQDLRIFSPHSADTKANLGIKNLEKEKPEKID
jgi:hypothetical protein